MSKVIVEDWRKRLRGGLIPAVPVPFDDSGRLHVEGQEAYVRHMSQQPVCGVAVWAHTGRGLLLSASQREEVLRSWRSGLRPGQIVVAGVGARADGQTSSAEYTAAAVKMAQHAERLGADALLLHPPTLFRASENREESILEYHRALARLDIPLILFYLYEAAGGIRYGKRLLSDLFALPQVIGIKMATLDSVMTFQDVARQLGEQHPDKILITGEDRFLGYSLMCGASAALIGMGAACCGLQAELIRCHEDRADSGRFLELSSMVDRLAMHTFIAPMEGYIRRMLWALVHLGVLPPEASFDPWGPDLPSEEFHELRSVLFELGELSE